MHILLVEDHNDLAATVADYLSHRGHSVIRAKDGPSALEQALNANFDAIVLDRKLPQLDGASVCRQLRAQSEDLPILMMTALEALDDKLKGFEAGADDYLVKPFALAELHARLTSLHRRDAHRAQIIKIDTLRYDLLRREGRRGERALNLSPTGRTLLEALLKARGTLVSRAELETAVWGESQNDSGALRVHMHALRSAVDRGEKVKLIHTRQGAGYWLNVDGS